MTKSLFPTEMLKCELDYTKAEIEKCCKENKIIIDGITYRCGRGNTFACSIRYDEMQNNITKICFSSNLDYYYIVTPEDYALVKNYAWIGEKNDSAGSGGFEALGIKKHNLIYNS